MVSELHISYYKYDYWAISDIFKKSQQQLNLYKNQKWHIFFRKSKNKRNGALPKRQIQSTIFFFFWFSHKNMPLDFCTQLFCDFVILTIYQILPKNHIYNRKFAILRPLLFLKLLKLKKIKWCQNFDFPLINIIFGILWFWVFGFAWIFKKSL